MDYEANYAKVRRNLAFFIGILLLSLWVGIEPKEAEVISLLSFQLTKPRLIPWVLFVVVLYETYNFMIALLHIEQTKRLGRWRMIDFGVVLFAAILSLVGTFFVLERADLWFSGPTPRWLIVFGAIVSSGFAATALAIFTREALDRIRGRRAVRADSSRTLLQTKRWALVYNPLMQGARKAISFNSDGAIGEGYNENEARWAIDDDELVIWKANGSLQNRFRYDSVGRRWVSTNDPAADAMLRGIKDQYVEELVS